MKNIGVILARLQPIHNGHMALIDKASKENDEVLLLIGSADKLNERNPIPFGIRMSLAKEALKDYKNVRIVGLNDMSNENNNSHEWGFYLYSHVVSLIEQGSFTMYYSDGYEVITSWFPGFILRNNVSLALLARNNVEEGISATKVREFLANGNDTELKQNVPKCVFDARNSLKEFIKISKKITE